MPSNPRRTGYCAGLAALLVFTGCESLQNATAEGDTRTISLHHIHTGEDLTITYKVNGRYDEEALKKINYELRDWRKNETIAMDPHLIDLVWEVQRDVGAQGPIWVVCGYRSPATNAMLRRRSSGVAKSSQHMLGKAMDFYIPGVPLEKLRAVGLYLERGGVGYYPTSGSPFVHMDTGHVRHWPAIASNALPGLLAQGRELHLAAAKSGSSKTTVLASLFGAVKTESAPAPAVAAPAAAATPHATVVAKKESAKPVPTPPARPAAAKPMTFELASAASRPVEPTPRAMRPAQAASLVGKTTPATGEPAVKPASVASEAPQSASDVINDRGYWSGQPESFAEAAPPRPPGMIPESSHGVLVASADDTTSSLAPWPMPERSGVSNALAYAAPVAPTTNRSPAPMPMGTGNTTAARAPAIGPDVTVAVKRNGNRPTVVLPGVPAPSAARNVKATAGERFNDPWMRAMIVSPSAQNFMSTSLLGATDFRSLRPYLQKPPVSVMMTFSEDPYLGMSADKFSGTSVVFVPTVTFSTRTASLR